MVVGKGAIDNTTTVITEAAGTWMKIGKVGFPAAGTTPTIPKRGNLADSTTVTMVGVGRRKAKLLSQ